MSACECGFPIDPDNKMYVAGAECICDLKGVFPAMTGAACESCGTELVKMDCCDTMICPDQDASHNWVHECEVSE
tara:strand:+ start:401 stop:625 length:225 start_codon:yes stop_codon:yes gene_type:complete